MPWTHWKRGILNALHLEEGLVFFKFSASLWHMLTALSPCKFSTMCRLQGHYDLGAQWEQGSQYFSAAHGQLPATGPWTDCATENQYESPLEIGHTPSCLCSSWFTSKRAGTDPHILFMDRTETQLMHRFTDEGRLEFCSWTWYHSSNTILFTSALPLARDIILSGYWWENDVMFSLQYWLVRENFKENIVIWKL